MIKVLFDGTAIQGYGNTKFHGGGEYAKFYLREALSQKYAFDIVFYSNRPLDKELLNSIEASGLAHIVFVNNKAELYTLIDNPKYERFYSALPYEYGDYMGDKELLGVIHGIRGVELPWSKNRYKYESSVMKRAVARLVNIIPGWTKFRKKRFINKINRLLSKNNFSFITVSHHSKYSILNHFPNLDEKRIKVHYAPFDFYQMPNDKTHDMLDGEPYFLLVSANRYEKNVAVAIETLDDLIQKGRISKYKIVILGSDPSMPIFKNIKNKESFVLKGYVSVEELDEYFEGAYCFIYPSLNEGFGYPPIQAMKHGIPVIASSATSIPEATGNKALYFNPESHTDLASRILFLLNSPSEYKKLSEDGKKWVNHLRLLQTESTSKVLDSIFN